MSFWHRVEPNSIDPDVEEGTEARIADPLWLLARQWQLGEFKGEDAASPIHARIRAYSNRLDTFRNEAGDASEPSERPIERLGDARPLEARVEAERVLDGPGAVALAAEAGVQFLRRLELAGLGDARRSTDWRADYGFDLAAEGIDLEQLPASTRRRLALIERRGLDGRKLAASTTTNLIAHVEPVAQRGAVGDVFETWKAEYTARLVEPGDSGDCWVDERLEYGFSIGSRTGSGEVVLSADEYHGGHLDWYAFRVAGEQTHGLRRRVAERQQFELLPQPAMFRGQGAARWWEFEDRSVYFGNLSAGPADIARIVVAEYGAVYSDDWFLIPLELAVGTLNRVTRLDVFDVFGGRTTIRSTAVVDNRIYGPDRPFRLFELEGDDSAERNVTPWMLLPPALADSQNAAPVERVTLVRDEGANLGWAIEDTIELPTGESMPRRRQWSRPSDPPASDQQWRYQLQTSVPPWWIPLVPERIGEGSQIRLRRARMHGWDELDPAIVGAKGRVIGVAKPLRLYEEEVPRGGVQVERGWQRARGADGKVYLWMARRKRPGRGDRGSGLEFDVIDRS